MSAERGGSRERDEKVHPKQAIDVMQATATAQNEQERDSMSAPRTNGGAEIVDAIPKPDGKLFDARTVQPAPPTLMARLNEKSKDDVTITKGMAGIIVIALTAFGIFLGYVVPSVREGGRDNEKLLSVERQMEKLNDKFDDIQKGLTDQRVKDAESRGKEYGYGIGRADGKKEEKTGEH